MIELVAVVVVLCCVAGVEGDAFWVVEVCVVGCFVEEDRRLFEWDHFGSLWLF